MARINLLPWREEQRKERQRQFLSTLAGTTILGIVVVFLVMTIFDQKINHQQFRNDLVKKEIRKLEARITKIDELERTRNRLISRKQVIERLQASRSMTVELLDNLAKTIPVGVTLSTIGQQGQMLQLNGSSQSNARVSAYLRELETNPLFLNPQLDYVRTAQRPAAAIEPYEFSITVSVRSPNSSGEDTEFADAGLQGGAG